MNKLLSSQLSQLNAFPWQAYLDLCKLKVVALMLLTALVGMFLAEPGIAPLSNLVWGMLGIGLAACAGATLNHLVDHRLDAMMSRTRYRPIPSGRVSAKNALVFAFLLILTSTFILTAFVNTLTTILTLLTLIGYAGVYTLYLKRATPQNIVIGGAAGAAPPLLGWTAVTGQFDPHSLLLVLIIFVWTPPHFWALAIHRHKEYAKANIPMLPVTHGIPFTKLNILLYTLLLTAVSFLPYATDMSGIIYLVGVAILDGIFIYWSVLLYATERQSVAMKTFRYSIIYLMLLFVLLLVDHYW
jgi:protoheme IX farnesyltransferase